MRGGVWLGGRESVMASCTLRPLPPAGIHKAHAHTHINAHCDLIRKCNMYAVHTHTHILTRTHMHTHRHTHTHTYTYRDRSHTGFFNLLQSTAKKSTEWQGRACTGHAAHGTLSGERRVQRARASKPEKELCLAGTAEYLTCQAVYLAQVR